MPPVLVSTDITDQTFSLNFSQVLGMALVAGKIFLSLLISYIGFARKVVMCTAATDVRLRIDLKTNRSRDHMSMQSLD